MRPDRRPVPRGVLPIVDTAALVAALAGTKVQAIELRMKQASDRERLAAAREARAATRAHGVFLIVNDRPDIAVLAEADGVHLGQTDLEAGAVRRWLPTHMIIGVSCHSPTQVDAAVREGTADYLGYGPIFPTRSKAAPDPVVGLEGLREICRAHPDVPVIAIGGIGLDALMEIRRAGATGAAMISALLSAPDPARAAIDAVDRWGQPANLLR